VHAIDDKTVEFYKSFEFIESPIGARTLFLSLTRDRYWRSGKIVGGINIVVDISERKQAETQQRILLNELRHRVKNNMQMLQILLEAGTRRAKRSEARELLEEASGRIMAMAAAQRVLYTTHDATRFNARDFLNTVCETTRQTFLRDWRLILKLMPCSYRTMRQCRSHSLVVTYVTSEG
jgi:two-component sensor histidine kinase